MRFGMTTPLLAALGATLAGCAEQRPVIDRPAKPVVATVVLKVPGMT